MRKAVMIFLISLTTGSLVSAQNEVEALRFSRTFHMGSARFAAMGGAFAAVGGDLSTFNFNPAGIGVYRRSEIGITPSFKASSSTGSYMGSNTSESMYSMSLPNIGGVANIDMYKTEGLLHLNFGFAYNQTVDFDNRIAVRQNGVTHNRLMDYFSLRANNEFAEYTHLSNVPWMAFEVFAIDTAGGFTDGYQPGIAEGTGVNYTNRSRRWGSMGEYSFTAGGNVSNIFYFGVTLGITSVVYNETMVQGEQSTDRNTFLQFYNYNQHFRTTGTGYNAKFGVIFWPFINTDLDALQGIRVGAAIHTPTITRLTDRYSADMRSNRNNAWINTNFFTYGLESPSKAILGLAYVAGAPNSPWRGMVSADWEFVDYSRIRMREVDAWSNVPGESVWDMNDHISQYFSNVSNLRFGGELGYDKLAFRLGYAYYGNPYRNSPGQLANEQPRGHTYDSTSSLWNQGSYSHNENGAVQIYSGGLGVQTSPRFTLNLAYQLKISKEAGYLYQYSGLDFHENEATVQSGWAEYTVRDHMFLLSFNWSF